jgi:hypothetical protein
MKDFAHPVNWKTDAKKTPHDEARQANELN